LTSALDQGIFKGAGASLNPRREENSRERQRCAVLLTAALAAYGALCFGYLTRTPVWQNPDEPAHYNYVAFVATTGGLPVLEQGDWDSPLLERVKNGTAQPGEISAIRYESWQPPLFYLLAAPIYRAGDARDIPSTLTRLRVFNAILGAVTLILAYFCARAVFPPTTAATVPLAITGIPMFTAVSSSLSADPLANLLAAAILIGLLTRQKPIVTGVLLGFGLLTKLELAVFIPLIAVHVRQLRAVAVSLIAAALLSVPWLSHQVTSYGWADPLATTRHAEVVFDQPRFPGFSADWVQQFLTVSFHSFWAQFGWMSVVAPDRLYWAWGVISLLAVVGLVIRRDWLHRQNWQLLLGTVAVAFIAYVGYNLEFIQFQSRYLFTAVIPIAALAVGGWHGVVPRWWFPLTIALVLVALNAYALINVLGPGFAPSA
jgi:Predicted membrane protein (DUF2142)